MCCPSLPRKCPENHLDCSRSSDMPIPEPETVARRRENTVSSNDQVNHALFLKLSPRQITWARQRRGSCSRRSWVLLEMKVETDAWQATNKARSPCPLTPIAVNTGLTPAKPSPGGFPRLPRRTQLQASAINPMKILQVFCFVLFSFPSLHLPFLSPLEAFSFGQALLTHRSGITGPILLPGATAIPIGSKEKKSVCLFHSLQRGLKAESLRHSVSRNSQGNGSLDFFLYEMI